MFKFLRWFKSATSPEERIAPLQARLQAISSAERLAISRFEVYQDAIARRPVETRVELRKRFDEVRETYRRTFKGMTDQVLLEIQFIQVQIEMGDASKLEKAFDDERELLNALGEPFAK